jgi:hypothetical protein
MRHVGSIVRSAIPVLFGFGMVLAILGISGCGESSTPPASAEEIKNSRLNRLVNERLQKRIEADAQRKAKGKARPKR